MKRCTFYCTEVLRIDSTDFELQTNCRWSCFDLAHWRSAEAVSPTWLSYHSISTISVNNINVKKLISLKHSVRASYVTLLKQQKSLCLTSWIAKVKCSITRRAVVLINFVVHVMQYATCQTWIANIEDWPVLNWLIHVSSSSCKGTFGLLHFMGSNTMIFAVLKGWHMTPLHCVLNW